MRRALVLLLLPLVGACISREVSELDPHPAREELKDISISTDIDILFVIDNSGSTSDKQNLFATNFPRFIAALDAFPTGRPNVHIGVVSSSVDVGLSPGSDCPHPNPNGDGLLHNEQRISGCNAPTDKWIEDIKLPSGTRQVNYAGGDLAATFSCIARLGSNGCRYEEHLEGMKRALDGSRTENHGFLRPGAYLAVVLLADEDDCSAMDNVVFTNNPIYGPNGDDQRCVRLGYKCDLDPISITVPGTYTNCKATGDKGLWDPRHYSDFLIGLKGDPSLIVAAVIAGDPNPTVMMTGNPTQSQPSCTATSWTAKPSIRHFAFLQPFGSHGQFATVCQNDFSNTLQAVGDLIFNAVTPCIDDEVDLTDIDPATPGLQLDCQVSDVQAPNTPLQTEQIVPRCQMASANAPTATGTRPCWWVKSGVATCTKTVQQLELHLERTSAPPLGTHTRVRCAANK